MFGKHSLKLFFVVIEQDGEYKYIPVLLFSLLSSNSKKKIPLGWKGLELDRIISRRDPVNMSGVWVRLMWNTLWVGCNHKHAN